MIYLDHHATTPLLPNLAKAMASFFEGEFGNPASLHGFGQRAQSAVTLARQQVAQLLNADPQQVIFTSGATESIHTAMIGWLLAQENFKESLILCSTVEHKSTLGASALAKKLGAETKQIPVDREGRINTDELFKALASTRPTFLSLIHGHNEIGTVQDVASIAEKLKDYPHVTFHLDGAQSVGKIPIDFKNSAIHLLSLSGHKLYGPKGIGALLLKNHQLIRPLFQGGGQEFNMRAGTLNVPAIVGLGFACQWAKEKGAAEWARVTRLRELFFDILKNEAPQIRINGSRTSRLPNNISLTLPKGTPETIAFALHDLAFSAGSACSSTGADLNHVLAAIGLSPQESQSTLRLGLGLSTTEEHIRYTAQKITKFINK
jgi:cysteine desulfurase